MFRTADRVGNRSEHVVHAHMLLIVESLGTAGTTSGNQSRSALESSRLAFTNIPSQSGPSSRISHRSFARHDTPSYLCVCGGFELVAWGRTHNKPTEPNRQKSPSLHTARTVYKRFRCTRGNTPAGGAFFFIVIIRGVKQ